MGRYDRENILGLHFRSGQVACSDCCSEKEWDEMTEDEVIVEDEDEVVFCDRCKKKL